MKRALIKISVFILSVFILSCVVYADSEYRIIVDGTPLDAKMIQENETLFIPVRSVSEHLGIKVTWDNDNKSVMLELDEEKTVIPENENYIIKNGELFKINNSPYNFSGRLYLDIKDIDFVFGCYSKIDKLNKVITVNKAGIMRAHFLNCGQGDSIFIELPDGRCMLIDSSTPDFSKTLVDFIKNRGYKKIDHLVATHPHIDHIGSMADVIENFDIGTFYTIERAYSTNTYSKMLKAIEKEKCETVYIKKGTEILGGSVKCTVLSPDDSDYIRLNNSSAVLKIEYNEVSFLLSGDAEAAAEKNMIASGANLKSDILKIGHHGSISSTTQSYLEAVNPKIAIISVGKDNVYGYPSNYVINIIKSSGAKLYRTDTDGNIIVTTDGKNIDVQLQKKEDV